LVMLLFKLITLLFSRHHRKKSLESCLEKGWLKSYPRRSSWFLLKPS
jgi:hypothetical protein